LPRTLRPAAQQPVSEDHRIHGTGASACDPNDFERLVFKKSIKNTPGEGAMRTTSL
jgi:hypothetical protein